MILWIGINDFRLNRSGFFNTWLTRQFFTSNWLNFWVTKKMNKWNQRYCDRESVIKGGIKERCGVLLIIIERKSWFLLFSFNSLNAGVAQSAEAIKRPRSSDLYSSLLLTRPVQVGCYYWQLTAGPTNLLFSWLPEQLPSSFLLWGLWVPCIPWTDLPFYLPPLLSLKLLLSLSLF